MALNGLLCADVPLRTYSLHMIAKQVITMIDIETMSVFQFSLNMTIARYQTGG